MKEYTRQELLDLFLNQKWTFGDLKDLVFEAEFPNELFDNAVKEITNTQQIINRLKELKPIVVDSLGKLLKLQREIVELSESGRDIKKLTELQSKRDKDEKEVTQLENEYLSLAMQYKKMFQTK